MSDDKNAMVQYLSFKLDNNTFAFNVLKTREVLSFTKITPIPCTPPYVAGVLNLRGSVVSVIDLRLKFGMKGAEITPDTAIIIVETTLGNDTVVLGALVDAVKGVLRFEADQIEPPPKIGIKLNLDLINGIGKRNDDFVIILNIDKVFSEEEITLIKETIDSSNIKSDEITE
ncbi:MAG: chemotaxis protein CheW [Spirochaetota bacterium]